MSLRGRLLLLLVALLLVGGIGAGVGAGFIASRDRQNNALRELAAARLRAEQLTTAYVEQINGLTAYIVSNGNDVLLGPYNDGVRASQRLTAQLRAGAHLAPGVRQELDRLDTLVAYLRDRAVTPAITLLKMQRRDDAIKTLLAPGVSAQGVDVRTRLDRIGVDIDRSIKRHNDKRNTLNAWLLGNAIGTLVALALSVLAAAILIDRWTKRPIDAIAAAVRKVRAGGLTTEVPPVGPPELAALGRDVDEMRARIIRELTETIRAREALEQNATVLLALRGLLEPEPRGVPAGWSVATGVRPAEGFVAGDSYDVALLPDGKLALVVIDIAGHGAVSAVTSLRCQELIGVALADGREPGDALGWLLEQMRDPGIELFFTAFVATIDPASGRCCYANAGHPSPLLTTDDGVVTLAPTGPIVGPIAAAWDSEEITIAPGGALAVYTDGLTDPRNVDEEHSPVERLTELLEDREVQPREIVERLLDGLELRNVGRLRDDVTLLVLCRATGDHTTERRMADTAHPADA
jgi:serine phosphatase RsbU (regulator of sigma subunit)/CHASE3 domain sensor protein